MACVQMLYPAVLKSATYSYLRRRRMASYVSLTPAACMAQEVGSQVPPAPI